MRTGVLRPLGTWTIKETKRLGYPLLLSRYKHSLNQYYTLVEGIFDLSRWHLRLSRAISRNVNPNQNFMSTAALSKRQMPPPPLQTPTSSQVNAVSTGDNFSTRVRVVLMVRKQFHTFCKHLIMNKPSEISPSYPPLLTSPHITAFLPVPQTPIIIMIHGQPSPPP